MNAEEKRKQRQNRHACKAFFGCPQPLRHHDELPDGTEALDAVTHEEWGSSKIHTSMVEQGFQPVGDPFLELSQKEERGLEELPPKGSV